MPHSVCRTTRWVSKRPLAVVTTTVGRWADAVNTGTHVRDVVAVW